MVTPCPRRCVRVSHSFGSGSVARLGRIAPSGRTGIAAALTSLMVLLACGGDTTGPPPPPEPPPPPPEPPSRPALSLGPGEIHVFTDPQEFASFTLASSSGPSEYHVVVMSGSTDAEQEAPLRLRASPSASSASVVPAFSARPPVSATTSAGSSDPSLAPSIFEIQRDPWRERRSHLRLLEQMEREIQRVGVGARPAGARGPAGAISRDAAIPEVGDSITLTSAVVGGGISCSSNTPVPSVVTAVGEHFVIVSDIRMADYFTDEDYQGIIRDLDRYVAPIAHEYFGPPTDLDGNGRAIAFFTNEVNRLSDPESGAIVIGFHQGIDHLAATDCPASNEGELIWLIGPDPEGEFGFPVSPEIVNELARPLVAHEYQHLLNTGRRVFEQTGPFYSLADLWINEGLSHIAEEVTGLHIVGLGVRQNLSLPDLVFDDLSAEVFWDYHRPNLLNVKMYLEGTTNFNALSISNDDLGFNVRGWGYQFLRWLGDQYGPAAPEGIVKGSGEHQLFRELAVGGPAFLFGPDNVRRAVNQVSGQSPSWADLLAQYFLAPAADDIEGTLPPRTQVSTWDTQDLWESLAANSVDDLQSGYPLQQRQLQLGPAAPSSNRFDLRSSTARYYRFLSDGAAQATTVEVTLTSGQAVPRGPEARVIVFRAR